MQQSHRSGWMLVAIGCLAGLTLLVGTLPAPSSTLAAAPVTAAASGYLFVADLNAAQEVPTNSSAASGFGTVQLAADEASIVVALRFQGLSSNQIAAHIHGPADPGTNAPVLFDIGVVGGSDGTFPVRTFAVTPAQVAQLRSGKWYFNIHSANFPGGEIRGQIGSAPGAGTRLFAAELSAAQEVPTNSSTATGFGTVQLAADGSAIVVSLRFQGLSSNQIAAHIHGPAVAGVNAPVLFNIGALGGVSGVWTRLQFPVTPAQVAQLQSGQWYFNVHSATFPGGEIRGQIGGTCGFAARLNGGQEVPSNAGTATGSGTVVLSSNGTEINVDLAFAGLGSNQVAAHIHGPAAPGVNAAVLFNIGSQGSTNGSFNGLRFAITPDQLVQLRAGRWYFNVHSANFPGGEIRGQLVPDCSLSLPAVSKGA